MFWNGDGFRVRRLNVVFEIIILRKHCKSTSWTVFLIFYGFVLPIRLKVISESSLRHAHESEKQFR